MKITDTLLGMLYGILAAPWDCLVLTSSLFSRCHLFQASSRSPSGNCLTWCTCLSTEIRSAVSILEGTDSIGVCLWIPFSHYSTCDWTRLHLVFLGHHLPSTKVANVGFQMPDILISTSLNIAFLNKRYCRTWQMRGKLRTAPAVIKPRKIEWRKWSTTASICHVVCISKKGLYDYLL